MNQSAGALWAWTGNDRRKSLLEGRRERDLGAGRGLRGAVWPLTAADSSGI